jgi:hypothetical protein
VTDKPTFAAPTIDFALPQKLRDKIWKPQDMLEKERFERIRGLQEKLFLTIKENPIPAEEVCAALGGCAVWMIGLNVEKVSDALEIIGGMKRDMKVAIKMQWEAITLMRKVAKVKQSGDNRIVVPEMKQGEDNAKGDDGDDEESVG